MNKFSSLTIYFQRLTLSFVPKAQTFAPLEHSFRKCFDVSSLSTISNIRPFSIGSGVRSAPTRTQIGSHVVPLQSQSSAITSQKFASGSIQGLSQASEQFSTCSRSSLSNFTECNGLPKGPLQKGIGDLCVQLSAQRGMASLRQMHKTGPHVKKRNKRRPLGGKPFMKGVVLKTLIKKPKKPNSANRKCVLVKLSNGKESVAHVPGEGHNLQEHHIVLVRVGRLKDVPGVKLKVVRGKYDCAHVVKKTQTK